MRRAMAVMALATLVSGCDYNRLVALREQIDAAWAQVENQLQRRNDLIPNLVEVTRGYAAHERRSSCTWPTPGRGSCPPARATRRSPPRAR